MPGSSSPANSNTPFHSFPEPTQTPTGEPSTSLIYKLCVLLLFLLGLCSFFLYKQPTDNCLEDADCGESLKNLLGPFAVVILYSFGAGSFTLLNADFASQLIERFSEFDKEIKHPVKRTLSKVASIALGLVGNISSAANAYSNDSPSDEIGLSFAGTVVSRCGKASGLVRRGIPHLFESVSRNGKRAYWALLECTVGLSAEQKQAQQAVYRQMENQKKLIANVKEHWRVLLNRLAKKEDLSEILDHTNEIETLTLQEIGRLPTSSFQAIIHDVIKKLFQLNISTFVILPILMTIHASIKKVLFADDTNWQSISLTSMLGAVEALLVFKIASDVGDNIFDLLESALNKKPIPNLTHQSNPIMTFMGKSMLFVVACFSFQNVLESYLRNAISHNPYTHFGKPGIYMVKLMTAFYHHKPMMMFFDSTTKRLTHDPIKKKLYAIESEVKKITELSPMDAHEYIATRIPTRIQIKWQIEIPEQKNPDQISIYMTCCCFFSSKKIASPLLEPPKDPNQQKKKCEL